MPRRSSPAVPIDRASTARTQGRRMSVQGRARPSVPSGDAVPDRAMSPAVGGRRTCGWSFIGLLETGWLGPRRRAARGDSSSPSCPSEATHPKGAMLPQCAGEMPLAWTGVRRHVRVLGSTTARSQDTAAEDASSTCRVRSGDPPTASGLGWRDGVGDLLGDECEDEARIRWLDYAASVKLPAAELRGVRVQVPPPTPNDRSRRRTFARWPG